ncbi:MAG: Deoxyribodipyrimidine photo-lyase [Promethearchaeota archaeon]|nr:MAG: Deoxyribodipyrimidine photo-lyase [Candidatus Lokiarchaeota archaeon]
MPVNPKRVRKILEKPEVKGPILYWMSRDQRVEDNWAFLFAKEQAMKKKRPLIILFSLLPNFKDALFRTFSFMLEGLKQIENKLKELNIPFILRQGTPEERIPEVIQEFKVGMVITDFSPLKVKQSWNETIKNQIAIPFYEVDAHNIIPVWEASEKKEYAAYTLRSKIEKKLDTFLEEFPKVTQHKYSWNENVEPIDWDKLIDVYKTSKTTFPDVKFEPGEEAAKKTMRTFLDHKFADYNELRNDPTVDGTSNLSPYLHFGQIASQRVVLESQNVKKISQLKNSFYDEIIVRKELSDNFCFYEPNYDKFEGFHSWAKETLSEHRDNPREYVYTREEFEDAKTHDDAWNAAQIEMKQTGKMHGYMRMYWGKKILQWTGSPEKALEIAIYLNDKFELDGRDPNGYTGIAWSIGGIHDRAWKERKIFGKVRYMSYKGLKRKFNRDKYINTYLS